LLDPSHDDSFDSGAADIPQPRRLRGRSKSSPGLADYQSRNWLSAVEDQSPRPPTRKLVKEMNGVRPSSSLELSETSEIQKDKGLLRRSIARLKSLYRRERDK
jgi:hypothetical protein